MTKSIIYWLSLVLGQTIEEEVFVLQKHSEIIPCNNVTASGVVIIGQMNRYFITVKSSHSELTQEVPHNIFKNIKTGYQVNMVSIKKLGSKDYYRKFIF